MIYVFTSAAWNYLPKSQMLAKSVKEFIPSSRMVLALPDRMTEDVDVGRYGFDEVIPLTESLVDRPCYDGWVFSHSIVELATAIKPYVLCELLKRADCEAVIYFDPDIVLFSRLDDLLSEFEGNSILLCPHVTKPEVNYQSILDNEIGGLLNGVYNFGFVGVKNSSEGNAFAKWWRDRCGEWCYDDVAHGVFTDQKWNDLVPGLFDGVKVLRNPRFDVATWNTTRRRFSGSWADGFRVDDQPLGFYHFTGFDSGAHEIMLTRSLAPGVQRQLTDWYKGELERAAKDPLCQREWAYANYLDGAPIPKKHRRMFRSDRGVYEFFANPFDVTGNSYRAWYIREIEGTLRDEEMTRARYAEIASECMRRVAGLDAENAELRKRLACAIPKASLPWLVRKFAGLVACLGDNGVSYTVKRLFGCNGRGS